MIKIQKISFDDGSTIYLSPGLKDKYGIIFCFTTRHGGYSSGKFKSLNIDYYTGDNGEVVSKNRELLLKRIGLSGIKKIYSVKQVHGDRILNIDRDYNPHIDNISEEADSIITGLRNTPVMVMGADCNLILAADIKKKIVAAVHAGWKGTLKGIAAGVIRYMINEFKSSNKDIFVAFSPSIRKCCYEVDSSVLEKFIKKFGKRNFYMSKRGSFFLDLVRVNCLQLKNLGIGEKNILDCGECTLCNSNFYSYRRSKITGRQAAVAVIL